MMMTTTTKKTDAGVPHILLCALVREGRDPPLQSFVDECFRCHRAVWRSNVSPRRWQAVCRFCVKDLQKEGTKMIERPPSKKVREAVERHNKELGTEALRKTGREPS